MSEEVARGVARTLLPEKAIQSLDQYLAIGGGQAIGKALSMPSQQVIAEMKRSGLRGRALSGRVLRMTPVQRNI